MSSIKTITAFAIVLLMVTSCNHSDYPGYKKTKNGIHYRLAKIGDDTTRCHYSDYITANIAYRTMGDSQFFSGTRKFRIAQASFAGSIDECITLLGKDDSASFILSAADFFKKTLSSELPSFLKQTDKIKIQIRIDDVQTTENYIKEKEAFMKWIDDFGEYEKTIIQQYIEDSKLRIKPLASGMYYIPLSKGNEKGVKTGDTITIHYEGRFLNGKFFDSTRKRNEPLQFVYGQQWQVIKGMDDGIGMMHEGEKALFIMPSGLAFGENGSSTGIIPPFTSLIFEVELISVNKNL
jgi:FKBP-type peptidyl-prolyl cis-trans isomerase FkpA